MKSNLTTTRWIIGKKSDPVEDFSRRQRENLAQSAHEEDFSFPKHTSTPWRSQLIRLSHQPQIAFYSNQLREQAFPQLWSEKSGMKTSKKTPKCAAEWNVSLSDVMITNNSLFFSLKAGEVRIKFQENKETDALKLKYKRRLRCSCPKNIG